MDQLLQSDRRETGVIGNPFGRGLSHLAGWIAAACAVVLAVVLAVVFAASMVVIGLVSTALVGFAAVAFKSRRPALARIDDGRALDARKVGHQWVAYGWDR